MQISEFPGYALARGQARAHALQTFHLSPPTQGLRPFGFAQGNPWATHRPAPLGLSHPVFNGLSLAPSFASSALVLPPPILDLGKTCQEGVRGDFRCKLLVGLEIYVWPGFNIRVEKKVLLELEGG